ncbi:MAG: hypothetical protein M3Y30_06750, partial [Gemmatimonadota bacterium]|nr:hypothetical protein [Gemmatimonadota bacterium]
MMLKFLRILAIVNSYPQILREIAAQRLASVRKSMGERSPFAKSIDGVKKERSGWQARESLPLQAGVRLRRSFDDSPCFRFPRHHLRYGRSRRMHFAGRDLGG